MAPKNVNFTVIVQIPALDKLLDLYKQQSDAADVVALQTVSTKISVLAVQVASINTRPPVKKEK